MENKNKITLLSSQQVEGKNKLDVLKKYGIKARITDFLHLTNEHYTLEDYDKQENELLPTAPYWTRTIVYGGDVVVVSSKNHTYEASSDSAYYGIRPVMPYSVLENLTYNDIYNDNGINVLECGEYPQWVVSSEESDYLDKRYNEGKIIKTGKKFVIFRPNSDYTVFLDEYIYNNDKYVRVESRNILSYNDLSKATDVNLNKYWIKVSPIKWIIDEKEGIAISKHLLLHGIEFNKDNKCGYFECSDIYKYLSEYMYFNMFDNNIRNKMIEKEKKDLIRKILRKK